MKRWLLSNLGDKVLNIKYKTDVDHIFAEILEVD